MAYDLTPLFRSTVGFDRLSSLLDTAFKTDERTLSYPPYNIEKISDDKYRITMALAGFKPEDIVVTAHQNTLAVAANTQAAEEDKGVSYLHKGIATRNFERKFSLADHVIVKGATLTDGLLRIELVHEVPEASKPRTIPVEGAANSNRSIDMKKAV